MCVIYKINMATKNHYLVTCVPENRTYSVKTDDTPVCPTNSSHEIETVLLGQSSTKEILSKIKEETIPTQGFYKADGVKVTAPGPQGTVTTTTFTHPFPVSVLSLSFTTTADMKDDHMMGYAYKDTVIGTITRDVNADETTIQVDTTAFGYLSVGFYVSITDGVNVDNLGRVTAKNSGTLEITVETAAAHDFSDITPTYVRMSVIMMDITIGHPWEYVIGDTKIGGSYVQANQTMTLEYTNNSDDTKEFSFTTEYLY